MDEIVAKEEDNEIGSSSFTEKESDQIDLEASHLKDSLDQTHTDSNESKTNDDDGFINTEYLDDPQIPQLKN